ncbi:MAG: Qat anti-phage system QueC-like protein QatC [Alistipes sp.]
MKIKVQTYKTFQKDKESYVEICIDILEGGKDITSTDATILMTQLSYFIGRVPETAIGFLYLSAIVYSIDRTFERKKYSLDGWSREFDVEFKIPAHEYFENNKALLESILSYLTGDYWACKFSSANSISTPIYSDSPYYNGISQVNLFSGGLDSLIGAIDFMKKYPEGKLFLASHYDSAMGGPKMDQLILRSEFEKKFKDQYITLPKNPAVLIEPSQSNDTTCRSRSLMFMAIALTVASYKNVDIIVPENGSVSLNYPLSISRRASCSTRTTHPIILNKLRELFSNLEIMVNICNPYEFLTKGEMVDLCEDRTFLLDIVKLSNSCGKRGRKQYFYDDHSATHCGRCMPCMYRKASLINFSDDTKYGITMNTLFQKRSKGLSDDFFAMMHFLKRNISEEEIKKELRIAGMGRLERFDDYVSLVHRTREELRALVSAEGSQDVKQFIEVI